jgi:hypothetical protein
MGQVDHGGHVGWVELKGKLKVGGRFLGAKDHQLKLSELGAEDSDFRVQVDRSLNPVDGFFHASEPPEGQAVVEEEVTACPASGDGGVEDQVGTLVVSAGEENAAEKDPELYRLRELINGQLAKALRLLMSSRFSQFEAISKGNGGGVGSLSHV